MAYTQSHLDALQDATQFTGCQRGAFGTSAAQHSSGVAVKANMDARPAVPDTEAPGAVQEEVVVQILVVFLDEVVIYVLGRQLCLDTVETHRLELQHHQRSGRILGERLVDADPDLPTGDHLTLYEMGLNELACDVASHTVLLSRLIRLCASFMFFI